MRATLSIDEIGDLLYQADYRKPVQHVTVDDKSQLVSVILDYHLMVKVKCCLDQFMEGLETLDVLSRLQSNSNVWKPFFVPDDAESSITPGNNSKWCSLIPFRDSVGFVFETVHVVISVGS